MKRPLAIAIVTLVVLTVALTGCASAGKPSNNSDPRKGRVTTEWSNCVTGDCLWSWKVCIGPDLIVHVDGMKPDHTLYGSQECAT